MTIFADIPETTLSDKEADLKLSTDVPGSSLVAESLAHGSFASFFASTSGHLEVGSLDEHLERLGLTPLLSERPSRPMPRWRPIEVVGEEDQVAKTNSNRVALLARKYVDRERFSGEERARLAIVTERVRRLLPAVAPEEYEILERFVKEVQGVAKLDSELRATLGMILPKDA